MKWKKVEKPKQKEKIKVLWYSNSPNLKTGYGKVTREVCSRLVNDLKYDIHVLGENYIGKTVDFLGFKLHGREQNEQEIVALQKAILKIKPDVLIILEDSFTCYRQGFHTVNFGDVKTIFYLPLDGGNIVTTGHEVLRNINKIIAMSDFTHDELAKENFDSSVIWHGVDTYDFRPANNSEKSYLRKKHGIAEDCILGVYFGRNSVRKRTNRLLEAAVNACLENDKLRFFLHIMHYKSRDLDCEDFVRRIMKSKCGRDMVEERRIIFNPKAIRHENAPSDKEVAEYIQMSDFTVSSTSGEGSGLLSPESFACGIPTIVTNYTTSEEWLEKYAEEYGKRGLLVPIESYDTTSYNSEHALINIEELKKSILWMADNLVQCKQMGINGRKFVVDKCDWNILIKDWKHEIEAIL